MDSASRGAASTERGSRGVNSFRVTNRDAPGCCSLLFSYRYIGSQHKKKLNRRIFRYRRRGTRVIIGRGDFYT